MNPDLALVLVALSAVLIFLILWKLTRAIVVAALLAVIAGGVLYVALPTLAERHDEVGDAARQARELLKRGSEAAKAVANDPATLKAAEETLRAGGKVVDRVKPDAGATP